MKNAQKLIEFLFQDSQVESERELVSADMAHIFEELDAQEEREPKKTPLTGALKELGVELGDYKLEDDVEGFVVRMNDGDLYSAARGVLETPDAMAKLADLGWIVTDCGDMSTSAETPCYRLRFLEIAVSEPENKDKGKKGDISALVKAAREFAFSPKDPQPEPKKVRGGVGKIKDAGDVAHSIKDSACQVYALVKRLIDSD